MEEVLILGKVIAFANQKGGVAKTTSAHNIAVALSLLGKKTLMIDLDSQASLTICAGIEPSETDQNNIINVLTDDKNIKKSIKECIHEIGYDENNTRNCYIIPSIIDLADLEWKMFSRVSRESILKRAIEPIRNDFDFIIIDCPPQLSILTINALSCADPEKYNIRDKRIDKSKFRNLWRYCNHARKTGKRSCRNS